MSPEPSNEIPDSTVTGELRLSILVDGQPLDRTVHVARVDIWNAVNAVPKAKVVLLGGTRLGELFPSDLEAINRDKAIEIRAGYDAAPHTIFSGLVVSCGVELTREGSASVVIDAGGLPIRMLASRKTAVFNRMRGTAVIEQLVSKNGLTPDVSRTGLVQETVVQNGITDWEFVLEQARLNGLLVTTDARTITVKPPDPSQRPALKVTYGVSMISINADTVPARVDQFRTRGQVSFQGSALPRPGTLIDLDGLGTRFNGSTFVNAVHHVIGEGAWTTHVEFGGITEPPEPRAPTPSGAVDPAVSMKGLQRGVVQQVSEGPAGAPRVSVMLPLVDPNVALWAQLASFYATDLAGAVFFPEVGDEVIVGFLNDDPRLPVVLGSVYDTKRPPTSASDRSNRTKAIVTRSKLEVRFDDTDRVITMRTPGGLTVSLNDASGEIRIADANRTAVTIGRAGIRLESPSDVAIKAAGRIDLKAGAGLAVQSTGDLSLQGLRVDVKADTGFKAQGGASADLVSSGAVTVQGSLVKIN